MVNIREREELDGAVQSLEVTAINFSSRMWLDGPVRVRYKAAIALHAGQYADAAKHASGDTLRQLAQQAVDERNAIMRVSRLHTTDFFLAYGVDRAYDWQP